MNKKIVKIGNLEIGSDKIVLIAGPCAIESEEELILDTKELKKVDVYRGGAFKSRTSPYSFSGLGQKGIDILILNFSTDRGKSIRNYDKMLTLAYLKNQ